jgi:CBS domain-containing protein
MNLDKLANKIIAVVTIDDPVDLAARHMWKLNIRHVPVVRGNVPVGMVSDRDVLFHVCWLDHEESSLVGDRGEPVTGASRIDQIMTTPAIVLTPNDSIEKAARLMLDKQISAVPLVAGDTIVGIVTETDFLRCYNDDGYIVPSQECRQSSIEKHMSARVFSVGPNDTLLTAIRLMRDKQIRHVPVVENDMLVGIVSDRDVLRGGPREVSNQAVSARDLRVSHEHEVQGIMTTHPEVIVAATTLAQAAKRMVANKIGALPVVEDKKLIGIITETDLLRGFVADCET